MNTWLVLFLCFVAVLFTFFSKESEAKECIPKDFNHGSIVCVCNATYCDTIDPVTPLEKGKYIMYTSNKAGLRFRKFSGSFDQKHRNENITLDPLTLHQKVFGFGGAFSDAAAYNIQKLPEGAKKNLLRSYYSEEGIEYSMGRVTIGISDFSLRYFSYDDTPNDTKLEQFNLTTEDYDYKIPIIKEALALTKNRLQLFGSSWSPPVWMKTNNKYDRMGFLKKEFYQTWADYHIKFLDEYRKHGIEFWGITTGNEPMLGVTPLFDIPSLGWMPWDHGKWIAENFGPAIRNNSAYSHLKIIALDDERLMLPWWMLLTTFGNNARDFIDGIGVHWYTDLILPQLLQVTNLIYYDKFLIGTEACAGDKRYKIKVLLGSWRRGEEYIEDIFEDFQYSFTGWLDWNIALNLKGGPSVNKNNVDSTIIVNEAKQEFYKQATFYAMGHLSKFVRPGSFRMEVEVSTKVVRCLAFMRPDKGTVIILYNRHSNDHNVTIYDPRRGYIDVEITKRSINTIVFW